MARSPAQRVIGTLLVVVALVAILGFYFLLFAESQQLDAVPGIDNVAVVAIAVAALLATIALLLVLLLASRGRRAQALVDDDAYFVPPEPEPVQAFGVTFEEVEDDLAVYDIWRLPVAQKAWATEDRGQKSFYFPLHVEGGVYVNDYIPIGGGQRLKLRTLLAGPPDIQSAAFTIPAARRDAPARMEPGRRPERPPLERFEERHVERPERRPAVEHRELPGDHFMRELERRFASGEEVAQVSVAQERAFYDYAGDVHDVIDVEGIGPVYAERLRQIGIHSTARLCYEDPATVAAKLDVPKRTVESWQTMSQLMKVSGIGPQYAEALARSGIDMEALRRRSPARLADEVNAHLGTLDVNIIGQKITERRVASWQEAAKTMRRVRMQIPEK